ncbi:HAD-like protein [Neolentinus lepideus HHB14362 ss-1]|uniref:HAD-like protein n=1 Tax=Neolentinus lepideus HHB14362 ss-1 TaxID=1314782 RepID=A0A165V1D3_9AGAM|nr:HAD-like protein [Neolentinus lepideus HHB14362 ss-1]
MVAPYRRFTTLLCDIGDVLFTWSSSTKTSIPARTLKAMMTSPTWRLYERGLYTQDECYHQLSQDFPAYDPVEIERAMDEARDSLTSNDDMIALLRQLKSESSGQLRILAMSNISKPDYAFLRTKPTDWSVFDDVYKSSDAGQRKPNLGFYRYVVDGAALDPYSTVYIDDKLENVLVARSLGMHGLVFDNQKKVMRALRNLIGDPVQRGRSFLESNAGHLDSFTNTGVMVPETFAQLLIMDVTQDRSLVNLPEQAPRHWNFFASEPVLTTEEFPEDLDTTSLGLTTFETDEDAVQSVMDEMLEYVNPDGIVMTYFDHNRPRFDPVVCVNVLSLFYTHNRSSQLQGTLSWVREVLLNRAYLEGTRYYASAECFLYFLSRLLRKANDPELRDFFYDLLRERVQERIGVEGDALALAMRILTCAAVGIRDDVDMRSLLPLQCEDGGWEMGWIYKYGSSDVNIGNRGLATAFAMTAIKAMEEIPSDAPSRTATPVKLPEGTPRHVKRSSSRLSLVRRRFMSWLSHSIIRSHALKTNF